MGVDLEAIRPCDAKIMDGPGVMVGSTLLAVVEAKLKLLEEGGIGAAGRDVAVAGRAALDEGAAAPALLLDEMLPPPPPKRASRLDEASFL